MSRRRFGSLVLCYHAVSDGWRHPLSVGPGAFERQLRMLLARRWRPASVDRVVDGRRRLLHVTFDDAFRSVWTAIPILERLGVPATVFACPAYADGGLPLAVPELADEARTRPDELATMTWDELRELAERAEVGSHTLGHPHLTRIADEELHLELRESKRRLEDELGRPCRYLAYPYGEHDERVREAARLAGYDAAFALPGYDRPIAPYALPRVGVYRRESLARLTLKTTPALRRSAQAIVRMAGRGG